MITGHIGIAFGARALDRREPDMRAPALLVRCCMRRANRPSTFSWHSAILQPRRRVLAFAPAVGILATIFGVAAFLHTLTSTKRR